MEDYCDIGSLDGNYTQSDINLTESNSDKGLENILPENIEPIIDKINQIIGYKVKPKQVNGKKIAPNRKFTSGTDIHKKLKQAMAYLKRTEKLKDPIKKQRFKLITKISRVTGGFTIKQLDGDLIYFNDRSLNLRENYNACIKYYETEYLTNEISQNEYNIPRKTRSIGTNTI
jgi:hypothetical protein